MKFFISFALIALLVGCQSGSSTVTNQNQPGPAVGRAVGTGAGAVSGQVVGGTVAAVEATGQTMATAFEPRETRVIRKWVTETTEDGREIQVQKEFLVDEEGRIIKELK